MFGFDPVCRLGRIHPPSTAPRRRGKAKRALFDFSNGQNYKSVSSNCDQFTRELENIHRRAAKHSLSKHLALRVIGSLTYTFLTCIYSLLSILGSGSRCGEEPKNMYDQQLVVVLTPSSPHTEAFVARTIGADIPPWFGINPWEHLVAGVSI